MKQMGRLMAPKSAAIFSRSRMSRGTTYSRTGSRGDPWANMATSSVALASSSPRKSQ